MLPRLLRVLLGSRTDDPLFMFQSRPGNPGRDFLELGMVIQSGLSFGMHEGWGACSIAFDCLRD